MVDATVPALIQLKLKQRSRPKVVIESIKRLEFKEQIDSNEN